MTRTVPALILAALAALLAACGSLTVTEERMQFALLGAGDLGYEVDDEGKITITTRSMTFSNAPGAGAVLLTGYEVRYFEGDGTEVLVGGSPVVNSGTLNLFVPAGIQCTAPDPVSGCTMLSEGARVAPGPTVTTTQTYQLLEAPIAQLHVEEIVETGYLGAGWYAEVVFEGYTMDDASFTTTPYRLAIVTPN